MSHNNSNAMGQIFKSLLVTTFKLIAIALSFTCRVVALLLTHVSELLNKITGHGSHH